LRPVREHDGKEGSRHTGAVLGKSSKHASRLGGYTVDNLALLAEQVPDAYRELIASEASRRRLDWADLIAQVTGQICGLVALLILAAVSWHAIDCGASTQGASIICTGAVSIVALFVTGRMTKSRSSQLPSAKPDRQTESEP
jgi:hypothetical protein